MKPSHPTRLHRRSAMIGRLSGWCARNLDRVSGGCESPTLYVPGATRFPIGSAVLCEIRNFLHRIEILCSKFLWSGVSLGPHYERVPCGCLLLDARTNENTGHTEQLAAIFPWATVVDYQIYLETRSSLERNRQVASSCTATRTHNADCPLSAHQHDKVTLQLTNSSD
jgi:hypothetical protein